MYILETGTQSSTIHIIPGHYGSGHEVNHKKEAKYGHLWIDTLRTLPLVVKALTNADDVELKDLLKLHEASQPIEIVDYMLVFENTEHPSFKEKETKILEEAAKKKSKEKNRRQTRYQAPARTSVLKVVDLPENLECDANKSAGDLVDDEIAQIRLEQSRERREHQQTKSTKSSKRG
ncbi:hypothetical protein BLNAU_25090 [Blattamonas nauphoetae]|uniref:Uncharacterized protein n=1 Tax=Blattamonas nauphoetae TaxID=2049346 RepID=A0ABQ9WPM3_9EUKA|nr:hypothetical protein BLNAU_25090 [Blattamonas nauphoetae]